ncbi:5-methyltetrahydropteroyltriglutamate--homocysteine methyltransferase [Halobacteriales archaeon QS_1_69_70]|nr:MAG: 5-methyltetrahydropteroyltriglutamate--homocysteine methyltransferase [Halobacteriales archaeon QS_1_69_70]
MTEVLATTPGLFPLPDRAKSALADLKGHQKDDLIDGEETGELLEVYDRARRDVIEIQTDAGLDRIVDGQLRWDDMLAHPLCVHDRVETRGIVRYYDNNNFYREPVVRGELTYDGDIAAELDGAAGVDQAVLPGPYSLCDLATDEHYGDDGEDRRASDAIDAVAGAVPVDTDVVVHTYWGAIPEKPYAHLMDAAVDAIGFDLIADHEQTIYNIQEYGTKPSVALGVVDGKNTLGESPEEIAERIEWVLDNLPAESFETVYATANTELFYLPVNKFEAKLEALAAAPAEVEL